MNQQKKLPSFEFPALISEWLELAKVTSDGYTIEFIFDTVKDRDSLLKKLSDRDWKVVQETIKQKIEQLGFSEAALIAKRSTKNCSSWQRIEVRSRPTALKQRR